MGSGKTTLGRRLADDLRIPFLDLDAHIETGTGKTVRALFESEGETRFRQRELEALEKLAREGPKRCILATGGGVVELAPSCFELQGFGPVVWLRADPAACVARLGTSAQARPLLDGDWRSLWERREALYAALAEATVDTHPASIETSLAALHAVWNADNTAGT